METSRKFEPGIWDLCTSDGRKTSQVLGTLTRSKITVSDEAGQSCFLLRIGSFSTSPGLQRLHVLGHPNVYTRPIHVYPAPWGAPRPMVVGATAQLQAPLYGTQEMFTQPRGCSFSVNGVYKQRYKESCNLCKQRPINILSASQ